MTKKPLNHPTRRGALKTLGGGVAAAAALPLSARFTHAQSAEPIRVGFQVHRTGIGAAYGRWYDRTTQAAVKKINERPFNDAGIVAEAIALTVTICLSPAITLSAGTANHCADETAPSVLVPIDTRPDPPAFAALNAVLTVI